MPTITIRDLPEHLHLILKQRARRNRRSLNQEVIAELAEVDASETFGVEEQERVRLRAEWMIKKAAELRKPVERALSARDIDSAKREGLVAVR
jgi:plasmid stability protein